MKRLAALVITLAACTSPDHEALRNAVDQSELSLAETVELAETSVQYSAGVEAALHPGAEAVYAVETVATGTRHDIRVDLSGHIVSTLAAGAAGSSCPTTISVSAALAIAEAEVGGSAVAVVPDDDDPCLREIQVLVDTTLWEVKLGPDGALIEKELSDEEL